MKILVSNVGSTSLKFKLFEMPEEHLLCEAKIERVGSSDDAIYQYHNLLTGFRIKKEHCCVPTYTEGIQMFIDSCTDSTNGVLRSVSELNAIGFKTILAKNYLHVHELTEEVQNAMREYLFVAPAHNGPYLEAIEQFQKLLPDARMIGVFETAFHTTIPQERRMYALPYEWYEAYGLQRMGYHGASHSYVADSLTLTYGTTGKTISCHLGGSCSLCAIENGVSVDTSFGFSLQTGLPHANRTGDTDPYIVPFLLNEGLEMPQIMEAMSKKGGLLGISGVSNDLRKIEEAAADGNQRAKLAIDMFVNSIIRYIGSFHAELGGLDNLVFTGGIGENSVTIRQAVCDALVHLGIILDHSSNQCMNSCPGLISSPASKVRVHIIPANEEIGVVRRTYQYLQAEEATLS